MRKCVVTTRARKRSKGCRVNPLMALRAVMVRFAGNSSMLNQRTSRVLPGSRRARRAAIDADLFPSFADGALLESFEEVDLAADDARAASFRGQLAQGEQHSALAVGQQNADANPGMGSLLHGGDHGAPAGAGSRKTETKRPATAKLPKNKHAYRASPPTVFGKSRRPAR